MRRRGYHILGLLVFLGPQFGMADEPPSYAKQVRPFLARYCLECHNAATAKGGLNLDTFQGLTEGGKSGPVLLPSKPDESRFVLMPEGKRKPAMPPKSAKQPKPEEVAVLRAWVAAGARDDSTAIRVTIPAIKPKTPRQAPVRALVYRPDGAMLAVGVHKQVIFVDPHKGELLHKSDLLPGTVSAVAFSHDGQRLAVAAGLPGADSSIHLFTISGNAQPAKTDKIILGHKDTIHALAFDPAGNLLATAGYDRLVKLWDVRSGREVRTLKDHSDAVYGLAFSPDGRLLATGSADRAVKIWEVGTGRRLHTLSDATDWVYAIAWSPEGKHLAAGGVDKSIRIWEVSAEAAKIVRSAFAHEGAVTGLLYAPDGKTLLSSGEDRIIKVWNSADLIEQKVYPQQPEAVLAFALRGDQKQIALGRYDGSAILMDAATGRTQFEPVPIKPKPPQLLKLSPDYGRRGQNLRVILEGKHLDQIKEMTSNIPGGSGKVQSTSASSIVTEVSIPSGTPAGVYRLGLKTNSGNVNLPFIVDLFPLTMESSTNDAQTKAQELSVPSSVAGIISQAGSIDYYRFTVRSGQEVGAQIVSVADKAKLDPVLQLIAPSGRIAAESSSGLLGHQCSESGEYTLAVRDREYRGGPDFRYRLHLGDIPIVTGVFPLGLQRGTESQIQIEGVNLGSTRRVGVKAPNDAEVGSHIPVPLVNTAPLGKRTVVVGEFPEFVRGKSELAKAVPNLSVPGTGNGRIEESGQTHSWRFAARKGQRLVLEVQARRLGSPLDSFIEILDLKGQPVPRATLRSIAKTYVTFRDHDSANSGIRIETWNELAMNDYIWAGNELLRIQELPKNPDDDCRFFSVRGQRQGYLDTSPVHLSLGTPLYKVSIHPPGTSFPPNGLPLITVNHRNDDGGPAYGKDSRLFFDPPNDGEFLVRIGDSHNRAGPDYAYRLTVRPPRPDFSVSLSPTTPAVWKGGAVPITISTERTDGYEGPIKIQWENLPEGLSAPATRIGTDENSTTLALSAEAAAKPAKDHAPSKLVARAQIRGREVRHELKVEKIQLMDPGDIVTTTDQAEVTVQPGREVRMSARIERRNGFAGRVPLDVRGLPRGVRVLDIGLNGILITEKEVGRSFVLYAEPWVEPQAAHPFVVLAKHEGKGTEHAAKSVLLKVEHAKK